MRKKFTDCVDIVGRSCENFEGTKFYISTGAVDEDNINKYEIEAINFEEKPSRANLVVKSNDIIFAKMQATKKTLLINEEFAEYVYSTGFCAVHAKKNILTRDCLLYLLMSEAFLNQKDKNCSGATQKAITNAGLQKIIVNIPDYKMQDDISKKLSILLKVINMRKNELDMLEDLIKARFVEMFGTLHNNENKFDIVAMEEICSLIKDGTHQTPQYTEDKENGYKFLSSKDVMSQRIDWTDIKYIPAELHEKLYATIKPQRNDILMSKNGVNYGVAAVNDTDEIFDIYVSLALLRPKKMINPVFLRCVINNPETKKQFDSCIKGIGVPNLHLSEIKKTKIFLPPIKLQNQFVEFVKQVDKSKVVVQKSLDETQMLFDSLMQKYFG